MKSVRYWDMNILTINYWLEITALGIIIGIPIMIYIQLIYVTLPKQILGMYLNAIGMICSWMLICFLLREKKEKKWDLGEKVKGQWDK